MNLEAEPVNVSINVPRFGSMTPEEGMPRLLSLLSSLGIEAYLDETGTGISYGDGIEGDEGEFIEGLTRLFDARFHIVH